MMNNAKKFTSLLLAFSILACLCACNTTNLEGTVVEPTPDGDIAENALFTDLSDALLLPDGTSLLDLIGDEIDAGEIPELELVPNMTTDFDDDDSLDIDIPELTPEQIEEAKLFGQHFKSKIAELNNFADSSVYILKQSGYLAASYCVNKLITAIMSNLGADTMTNDEKILERLQLLDDIYESVTRIEAKVNEINERLMDGQYYDAIADRQASLTKLYYATNEKYSAIMELLTAEYEEYLTRAQIFSEMCSELYAHEEGENEVEFIKAFYGKYSQNLKNSYFDRKFFIAYSYMTAQGDASLSDYMTFQLMYDLKYDDSGVCSILKDWAQQSIAGTKVLVTVKNLAESYSGGFSLDGRTYPEIYDYAAYKAFPWEHQGYEFREAIRSVDAFILNEAFTMESLYYTFMAAKSNDAERILANTERDSLSKCVEKYNQVQNEQAVVRREEYYICQIAGCEYVFARTPVYFDYYSQFKNTMKDICIDNSNKNTVSSKAVTALDSLFRNPDIAYNYELLDDSQKTKYTFDHSAIGDASDPYGKVDWDEVSGFAVTDPEHLLYLPQSAYVALLEYYKPYGYTSLTQIFEDVLGITFADGTYLVCDVVDGKNSIVAETFSVKREYYSPCFRITQKTVSKNEDYIDVRTCLDSDPSKLKNKRFADGLNLTNNECTFSNWGTARNRFGGLMVLGVQTGIDY